MGKKFFVTGTDTDIGKTFISTALILKANAQGLRTMGLKPIAAGCEATAEGLRNEDALQLQQASSQKMPYAQVNPIALKAAVAPHIAAQMEEKRLSVERTMGFVRGSLVMPSDLCLVEGAGGWRVPLNTSETLANLPKALNLPVILVVGIRLGCINHALLTVEAIVRDGLQVAGWVANIVDPNTAALEENIDTLRTLLPGACLGVVPFMPNAKPESAVDHLDITPLLDFAQ
ncbi:dethiobiotin synthase [Saccharophagus degradans]|uniref:dethiobiotin synthase n=1 Tax=Saccharophagus degradans TaxID=86304 RepID=UPI001C0A176C|nr:dethiobiotin synthase [Saccharophagus degradans]